MTITNSYSSHIKLINDIRNYADSLHNNIKFTIDIGFNNSKSLNILNTTEHICEYGMERDLYKKPNKISLLLARFSFHKPSIFGGIPIGMAHMTRSICTNKYIKKRLDNLKDDLLYVGFSSKEINTPIKPFYNMSSIDCRNGNYKKFKNIKYNKNYRKYIKDIYIDLINENCTDSNCSILSSLNNTLKSDFGYDCNNIWITVFWHPGIPNIRKLIYKYIHILHNNEDLAPHFTEKMFVFGYKRFTNLWEELHPTKFQNKFKNKMKREYFKDLKDKFSEDLIIGDNNILCIQNHRYLMIYDDTGFESKCKVCNSYFYSDLEYFGCEICDEYICRRCITFNCPDNHGLKKRKNNRIQKICDLCNLCDIANSSIYYGCDKCDYDICINCINMKFAYNNKLNFNYLSLDAFLKDIKFINSAAELYRKKQPFQSMKCGNNRCKSCTFINTTNTITSKTYNITYNIENKVNCNTKNGSYIIQCRGIDNNNIRCNKQYGGSTILTFRSRQNGHKQNIRDAAINKSEVYRHFNNNPCMGNINDTDCNALNIHHALKYYSFTPFSKITLKGNAPEDILFNEYELNVDEQNLQAKIGSIHSGLNGTGDWNNTHDCRRMKNIADKIPNYIAMQYK